jgi:drug/metabolite transporter (DMT)-like permease
MDRHANLPQNKAQTKIGSAMLSLTLGIIAALAWGVHDVCVRFVTARVGVPVALMVVLATGLIILTPLTIWIADWGALSPAAGLASVATGLIYSLGYYGLYRAFAIGPVRLVAPVTGAFPILSLAWAAAQGQPPTLGQIGAVVAIVAGVGLTAALSDQDDSQGNGSTKAALCWAVLAACGFALTFAVGQFASASGAVVTSLLISRLVAFAALLTATLLISGRPRLGSGVPWKLLLAMGACDALALSLVLAAGSLPNPEFASVASSTFGMVTILLAWGFLKEKMTPPQWGAVAMVFAGIGYLAL